MTWTRSQNGKQNPTRMIQSKPIGPDCNAYSIAFGKATDEARFIQGLTRPDFEFLYNHWPFWARPEQCPPDGDWHSWLFLGGRGAGKTRAGAQWVSGQMQKGVRCALIGPSLHDVREVMIEGPSGLRSIASFDNRPHYEVSRRRLIWPKGGVAYVFSAEDADSLRGPQFHLAWLDEYCAWPRPEICLSQIRMGLRLGEAPKLCVTTTPRPIKALRTLMNEKGVVVSRATTQSNSAFLSKGFLDQLDTLYGGTRLMQQEMMGQVLEDENGALFPSDLIERAYHNVPDNGHESEEMILAIDPSITQGGDACGLILASRQEQNVIIHEDATQNGLAPIEWAKRAVALAERFHVTAIVAESNQGGEMIMTLLKLAGAPCPIRLRHASRSKSARAEPVAALYEQGRVKHRPIAPKQRFTQLDEELMSLNRYDQSGPSPNRADALIWAVSEILLSSNPKPRLSVI